MSAQDLLEHGRELDPTASRLLGPSPAPTQLLGRTHWPRLCHIFVAGLLAVLGCASKDAWSLTERRVCAPKDPAQLCSLSAPDYGHVITVGDAALLPGECAVLSDEGRSGLIRVETRDPRGARARRWVRVPKSQITILEVPEHGKATVYGRQRCDRTPVELR